jgi:hypothetical protein
MRPSSHKEAQVSPVAVLRIPTTCPRLLLGHDEREPRDPGPKFRSQNPEAESKPGLNAERASSCVEDLLEIRHKVQVG